MKMIYDVDRYYENYYTKDSRPSWMKAERIEFCEQGMIKERTGNFFRNLIKRNA